MNKLKVGDRVRYADDLRVYTVYGLYPNNQVSLGLYEYPDTEQDETINADELIKV